MSVDPLSAKYAELTPYQFASDRPIDGIDLDGLEYASPANPPFQQMEYLYNLAKPKDKQQSNEQILKQAEINQRGFNDGTIAGMAVSSVGVAGRFFLGNWVTLTYSPIAQATAVGFVAGLLDYNGADLEGPGDDFGRIGRKGYEGLIKKGITNQHDLAVISRRGYNKIVGTIDKEIENLPGWKEKAEKAFDIRNKAKDFARELSGPENKLNAEQRSLSSHKNIDGPTFEFLYDKEYKNAIEAGFTEKAAVEKAYKGIIESSKRTSPEVNAKFD